MEGVKEITRNGVKFLDGQDREFDAIVLATGYKNNVPIWLKVCIWIFFFVLSYKPDSIYPNIFESTRLILCYSTNHILICMKFIESSSNMKLYVNWKFQSKLAVW